MCEFCGSDGSCCVCGGVAHDEPKRVYARRVATACAVGMLLLIAVAGICAAVNLAGGAK